MLTLNIEYEVLPDRLEAIFGDVLVPEAVFSEVTAPDKPHCVRLRSNG